MISLFDNFNENDSGPSLSSQALLVAVLATSLHLSLSEQSGLLKHVNQPAEEARGSEEAVQDSWQEADGKQRAKEVGAGILRPDVPLANPNQHSGSQLKISGVLSHGMRLANGHGELDRSAADLSINPWSWEPQRIQPRRQKTHFLTKKFQEKSGRDLLKRQVSFISEHDQASGFENVVVKAGDYDKGEKAIVRGTALRNLGSDSRPASGERKAKKCIDSDKLLFCISSAKVVCPQN